jgi:hypothetical protein
MAKITLKKGLRVIRDASKPKSKFHIIVEEDKYGYLCYGLMYFSKPQKGDNLKYYNWQVAELTEVPANMLSLTMFPKKLFEITD